MPKISRLTGVLLINKICSNTKTTLILQCYTSAEQESFTSCVEADCNNFCYELFMAIYKPTLK